jgi:hypothetical protein
VRSELEAIDLKDMDVQVGSCEYSVRSNRCRVLKESSGTREERCSYVR